MKEKALSKGNISCTLKCMNVKCIYIAATWVELLLNQTIVPSENAIKKENYFMIFNRTCL